MKRIYLAVLAVLALALPGKAMETAYTNQLVSETGLAYNNSYTLDLDLYKIDYVSMEAVYSTNPVATVTFKDGTVSTGTLTVASTSTLAAASATNTITVTSTSTLVGSYVNMNGVYLLNGTQWQTGTTTTNTAINIMTAINATSYGITASTANTNVVTLTVTQTGYLGNTATLAVNGSGLSRGAANFAGGQDNAYVTLNGIQLTQGTDWTGVSTASGCAQAISNAIMANASLNTIIVSTWSGAVVYATSTAAGVNAYPLYCFPPASITRSSTTFLAGAASNIVTASNQINVTSHGLTKAQAVLYTKTAGTSPGSLSSGTTYYVIPVDTNNFKLASSTTNAVAGTNVAIGTQTVTGGGTFTLANLAFTGTPALVWQASNDNANWVNLSVSSVSFASPYTAGSQIWDLGLFDYRYLRMNVTAPTTGVMTLTVTGYGKRLGGGNR